jgi:hypothetical protein
MKLSNFGSVSHETKGTASLGLVNDGGVISTKYYAVYSYEDCRNAPSGGFWVYTISQDPLPPGYKHCTF